MAKRSLTPALPPGTTYGPTLGDSLRAKGVETQKPNARAGHWTQNIQGAQGGRGLRGAANKTEVAYGQHLDFLKTAGEVVWWRHKPGTLRITDTPAEGGGKALVYSPDFMVVYADRVELHDTKGNYTSEAAWSVMRAAAEVFTVFIFAKVTKRLVRDGGGFSVERL